MKTFKFFQKSIIALIVLTTLSFADTTTNDSCANAELNGALTNLSVATNITLNGTLTSGNVDEQDYYKITVASTGTLEINTTTSESTDFSVGRTCTATTCGTDIYTNANAVITSHKTGIFSVVAGDVIYFKVSRNNKNLTYNMSISYKLPPTVGWENASYQISENIALPYGQTSQLAMNIVLSGAVDYPITVVYQTHDVTAIGDRDYSIVGGTVTIPAGTTSKMVNMYIFHDEAIELDETFNVILSSPAGSGGVTLRSDRTTAPVLIAEQTTAPLCYDDSFSATLDSKWRTLFSNGGFTPAINNGHLKLTPGKKNIATAVTKDYEFPSKENLIVIEFQHYAYGGCFEESTPSAGLGTYGADGIVAVLYNSAVGASPVPGSYGGSMGYAQRTGVNGFQGGWLGLGLDEYGNFGNCNEGRIGGLPGTTCDTNTAFNPQSYTNRAVIRGDGSGTSGYEFLSAANLSASPLAPLVDYTNPPRLPGDKFRMTVDARDNAHLYITLERDTGTGYVTVINKFDAKLAGYNQSTTPDFVRFALTAGTGGGCNAHEIDELKVWGRCTPYNPTPGTPPANTGAVDVVDNYPTNGYATQKGLATKITSKPANTLDAVWLGTAGGGTAVPYYTAGNNDVVDMPVLFYVSDINSTDDNAACTTERYQLMGANGSPLVATFQAGDTYARTTSSFTVQSSAKKHSKIVPKYINFYGMNLLDPSITCLINSSNSGNIAGLPQCVNSENQYLSAFGQAAVNRCRNDLTKGQPCMPQNGGVGTGEYNHNYGCYQCTLDALATKGCSSDAFAIRPDKFVIASTNTAMPNLLRAGQEYNNIVHAYNYNTTTNTIDYNVSSAMNVFNLVTTKYNRNNVITASMAGTATLPTNDMNMSNGISTKVGIGGNEVAGLVFNDVGKINLSLQDRIWSAVDDDDIPSALNCSGTYICSDKNVTFIPDHFDFNELNITNNNGNPGSFTYIANQVGQMAGRIHTQIRALNTNAVVTQNFATFPLWENNISITPVVTSGLYLHPDANETTISNLALGFTAGTKTIPWNETNTSHYLRFNFPRDVNPVTPPNPFDTNGADLNIAASSIYVDGGNQTTINGSRNGTADGSSRFVYGRIIPRDVRVFGANTPFTANGWYEVFNTPAIGTTALPISKNSATWSTNTLHNDANDGDGNVIVVITGANPVNTAAVNGVETYTFVAGYAVGGYQAHIRTAPWLWYGINALPYLDPANAANLNCLTHPCFNINVVPSIGATGSAKSTNEANKDSKRSIGGGAWQSTTDYAPAVR
ncbi:MAG: Calx-beta domain-containing protein [Sulfuricurvum sp.]|nr:Calx-beta domain-containing protein [Sulfuricurvum sp.]